MLLPEVGLLVVVVDCDVDVVVGEVVVVVPKVVVVLDVVVVVVVVLLPVVVVVVVPPPPPPEKLMSNCAWSPAWSPNAITHESPAEVCAAVGGHG